MGAPFDADTDEMQTAALMVTVRNERGRAMLDAAVRRGRVEVLLAAARTHLIVARDRRSNARRPHTGEQRAQPGLSLRVLPVSGPLSQLGNRGHPPARLLPVPLRLTDFIYNTVHSP